MPNALVAVHDHCLPSQHRENVALWTHHGARRTANAVGRVYVGMLRGRSVREDLALFSRRARGNLTFLQSLQIAAQEKCANNGSYQERDESIHLVVFYPI